MENDLYNSGETTKNIIVSLSSSILEIKEKYLNAGFKENEFAEFLINNVNESLTMYNDIEPKKKNSYIIKYLSAELDKKIKITTEEKINEIVALIEKNIKDNSSVYQSLKNLNQILSYIKNQNLIADLEVISLLSLKCPLLNMIILDIVNFMNENKSDKILDDFDETKHFLDDYCSIKEIARYSSEPANDYYINDTVKQYLKEISRYKLLSKEESHALEKLMVAGDKKAKEILINHNLRLVVTIAKKHVNKGLDLLDLIQHGNIGLVKSADKFNINKGVKFSSYAGWWIRHYITKGIDYEAKMIRKPSYIEANLSKMQRKESDLILQNGYIPTIKDLANELGVDAEEIKFLKEAAESIVSLNNLKENDETREYISCIRSADNTEEEAITSVLVQNLLDNYLEIGLTKEEIDILKYRNGFFENRVYTHRELAPMFKISAGRVQQIEHDAILRLRDYYEGTHNFKKKRNKKKRQVI